MKKMKIRFCANHTYGINPEDEFADVYAEFDVAEAPTIKQIDAIYKEIDAVMECWEEENDDFCDFNFYVCCRDACVNSGVKIVENPVVTTFYI